VRARVSPILCSVDTSPNPRQKERHWKKTYEFKWIQIKIQLEKIYKINYTHNHTITHNSTKISAHSTHICDFSFFVEFFSFWGLDVLKFSKCFENFVACDEVDKEIEKKRTPKRNIEEYDLKNTPTDSNPTPFKKTKVVVVITYHYLKLNCWLIFVFSFFISPKVVCVIVW
jgi:hypothetical protein